MILLFLIYSLLIVSLPYLKVSWPRGSRSGLRFMILNPAARVRNPEWGDNILWEASITAQGLPEPSTPSGVVHWVPEQLNYKVGCNWALQVDKKWLQQNYALCPATVSVISAPHMPQKWRSIQLHALYRRAQPKDSILYIKQINLLILKDYISDRDFDE